MRLLIDRGSHGFDEKLFRSDDFQSGVFLRQFLQRKEIRKIKSRVSQEIHFLRRRQHQDPSHGQRQGQHGFHAHSNIVPSTSVRFKGQILSLAFAFKGRYPAVVLRNISPIDHFVGCVLFHGPVVFFAIQSGDRMY